MRDENVTMKFIELFDETNNLMKFVILRDQCQQPCNPLATLPMDARNHGIESKI